jgi:hypothetical protein
VVGTVVFEGKTWITHEPDVVLVESSLPWNLENLRRILTAALLAPEEVGQKRPLLMPIRSQNWDSSAEPLMSAAVVFTSMGNSFGNRVAFVMNQGLQHRIGLALQAYLEMEGVECGIFLSENEARLWLAAARNRSPSLRFSIRP